MFDNKGFILYDGLLSFILLSSSIIFFNKMIYVNTTTVEALSNQVKAINALREGIYNDYQEYSTENYSLYNDGGKYCVSYIKKENTSEICIFK